MKMRNLAFNLKQKPKNENNTYEKKVYYAFGSAIPCDGNECGTSVSEDSTYQVDCYCIE